MTDTTNVQEPEDGAAEEAAGEAELRGRYVEGSYGKTGTVPGRTAGPEIGQYAEGDYGTDGKVGPSANQQTIQRPRQRTATTDR